MQELNKTTLTGVYARADHFERYTKNMALMLAAVALVDAIIFFICFHYMIAYNNFGALAPYVYLTMLLIVMVLHKNNLIENKRAFVWLLPLSVLSAFFYVLEPNFYTVLNIPVIVCLFAVFSLTAAQRYTECNTGLYFVIRMITVAAGNWFAFLDLLPKAFRRDASDSERKAAARKVFLGVGLAIPFMLVIVSLLMSADKVFSFTLTRAFSGFFDLFRNLPSHFVLGLCLSVGVFMYAIGYVCYTQKYKNTPLLVHVPKSINHFTSMGFLIPINMLFFIFTVFQFAFLWGNGFMQLPDGLVYSVYAREGFFQLLFVTAINFSIILFYVFFTDHKVMLSRVRYLLLSLCLFTGVLVASSFYRMGLYIGNYGYTSLRLSVITFLIMEVLWLIAAILYLLQRRFDLGKWILITGFTFYIAANITGSIDFANWMHETYFLNSTY